jgi:hypothetical protein
MENKTCADKMWAAQMEFGNFEDDLCNVCIAADIPFEDFTHDWYDASIELYGVPAKYKLTEDQQKALWDFGFFGCWTHTVGVQDGPHNKADEEHYYQKGK